MNIGMIMETMKRLGDYSMICFDTDEIDSVIHGIWWLIESIVKNNDEERGIYGSYRNLKAYKIGEDITEELMGKRQVAEYKEEIERQSRMEEEEWKKKELAEKEREKQERYKYYQKLKKEFEGDPEVVGLALESNVVLHDIGDNS
jgi:hypothetical protein